MENLTRESIGFRLPKLFLYSFSRKDLEQKTTNKVSYSSMKVELSR